MTVQKTDCRLCGIKIARLWKLPGRLPFMPTGDTRTLGNESRGIIGQQPQPHIVILTVPQIFIKVPNLEPGLSIDANAIPMDIGTFQHLQDLPSLVRDFPPERWIRDLPRRLMQVSEMAEKKKALGRF